MKNNTGIFNSNSQLNDYIRSLRSASFPRFTTRLSADNLSILEKAKRGLAQYHEGKAPSPKSSPTPKQVTDLLADLAQVEVEYPAELLEARRASFVAQITNAGQAGTHPAG
jgi:hypothetical protein